MATRSSRKKAEAPARDPGFAALIAGDHGDPFAVLGPHREGKTWRIRAFLPDARRVAVLDLAGRDKAEAREIDPAGLFEAEWPDEGERPPAYRFRADYASASLEFEDPYRFPPVLGEMDLHLLAEGNHLDLYRKLGAHPVSVDGVAGTAFAVWAPNAARVSVVGGFNQWDGRRHPMRKRHEAGIWELFVPGVGSGELYKFEIKGPGGTLLPLKADPLAFRAEHPPQTASIVAGDPEHRWADAAWMGSRAEGDPRARPMSIYEVHLGSWRRGPDNRMLTYGELAETLVPYAVEMGFTHLELLPITEFPFDGSWGYQATGLFAPTSRFGSPSAFAAFVDAAHRAGLGVILDWVPGHFPRDSHSLARFDGTALYEHEDPRQGEHRDWGTLIYNYGRREVTNFLLASALFWLDRYHLDGLRVDAVASMLYLDYSREAGEWVPNRHGGRENLEAMGFLRRMNELVYGRHPGAVTIAEESTAWPAVSRPTYLGGLGFGFKWNMGWMHDTLRYIGKEPVHRRWHHHDLTFGMLYAFSENFILPLSHDEVVHGKGSLLGRMPGDAWQRFANLRAYFGFMWGHPGKKLLFMGGEFAQGAEWNHDQSLDWHLLNHAPHAGMQRLIRDLNRAHAAVPALHERDCEPTGFEWIEANDNENSVIAWLRWGENQERPAVVICNFTPIPREGYRLGVPLPGRYVERVNTDAEVYAGSGMGNGGAVEAEASEAHGRPFSLCLTLPPLATLILEREG